MRHSWKSSLNDFEKYLGELGFARTSQTITVDIRPGTTVKIRGQEAVAVWDDETSTILVASAFATDQAMVLRQLAQNLLHTPQMPLSWADEVIKSRLASYFPCSFTDEPIEGKNASDAGKKLLPPQDLRNSRPLNDINLKEWWSIENDGGVVWGGAFWRIREIMGRATLGRFLAEAWRQRASVKREGEYKFVAFASDLVNRSKSIQNGKYTEQIRRTF